MQNVRIVAAFALLAPLAAGQTDAGLWRFVHPNAKALIGVDVHRIKTSALAQEMSSQLGAVPLPMGFSLPGPGGKIAANDVSDWTQLANSVDRLVMSSPGRAGTDNPDQEPPVLIAMSGHFEPVKLAKMFEKAGCRPQHFESVTIYRPQKGPSSDFGFVILNSQTLLIGDAKSLFLVIDRVEKGGATPPPIVEQARDMDVAYDFWAILSTPPSAMSSSRFPLADMGSKLNGFQAGIAVREGLAIDVDLNTTSEAAAKGISAQLSKLLHLVSKDRENHPEWSGIDRKLHIRVDKSDVHLALRISNEDVTRMAKSFEKSHAQHTPLQASAPVMKPAQQQPLFIHIDGLDSGPREIPYHPEK